MPPHKRVANGRLELAERGDALTARLLARFESQEGYRNFPETVATRAYSVASKERPTRL
jgi:hypothetical protein